LVFVPSLAGKVRTVLQNPLGVRPQRVRVQEWSEDLGGFNPEPYAMMDFGSEAMTSSKASLEGFESRPIMLSGFE
jgi:hypothetical protein